MNEIKQFPIEIYASEGENSNPEEIQFSLVLDNGKIYLISSGESFLLTDTIFKQLLEQKGERILCG